MVQPVTSIVHPWSYRKATCGIFNGFRRFLVKLELIQISISRLRDHRGIYNMVTYGHTFVSYYSTLTGNTVQGLQLNNLFRHWLSLKGQIQDPSIYKAIHRNTTYFNRNILKYPAITISCMLNAAHAYRLSQN